MNKEEVNFSPVELNNIIENPEFETLSDTRQSQMEINEISTPEILKSNSNDSTLSENSLDFTEEDIEEEILSLVDQESGLISYSRDKNKRLKFGKINIFFRDPKTKKPLIFIGPDCKRYIFNIF